LGFAISRHLHQNLLRYLAEKILLLNTTNFRGDYRWAFVCVGQTQEGHPLQRGARSGAETDSTHNRMKLKAALEGLLFCKGSGVSHATVVSNSDYLIDGMNGQATVWRNRGWRNKSGLVPNVDLWEELLNISGHISVNWGRSYGDVSGWAAMAKQLAKEQRIDEDLI
jgi:ribonuclease HI